MIKLADETMKPALMKLWRDVFGDPEEYVNLFFTHRFRPDEALVHLEGERPVAVLYMLPLTFTSPGKSYQARYIYAVATDPAFRSRGLSSALLEASHQLMADDGTDLSVLVPASDTLFDFYKQRGYRTQFTVSNFMAESEMLMANGPVPQLTPAELPHLAATRDSYYAFSNLYGRWDDRALVYAGREIAAQHGEVLSFVLEGETGYAVCYLYSDRVEIRELIGGQPMDILAALHKRYGREKYFFRLWDVEGKGKPFAMARWLTEPPKETKGKPPYLGLVLD